MIEINTQRLKDLEQKVQKSLRAIKNVKINKRIANIAIDIIYKRVKAGGGVISDTVENAKPKKLRKLSKPYIRRRHLIDLGPFGRPAKSNLTLTGQMLEALFVKVTSKGFKIDVKNQVRLGGGSLTNKQVANFVSEKGRPWLALTVTEQRILLKEYGNIVRELARRIIT